MVRNLEWGQALNQPEHLNVSGDVRRVGTAVAQRGRPMDVQPCYAPVTDAVPCSQGRAKSPIHGLCFCVRGPAWPRARVLDHERLEDGAERSDDLVVATEERGGL